MPKSEWNKINTNLFKSITGNIDPFGSIAWHQKEPWFVLYTHIAQLITHATCIHSCCLPCNYVTNPIGIFQRVIKKRRLYIYKGDLA